VFKRLFDITFSFIGLFFLAPFFLIIACFIKIESSGPVFFRQVRVGKNNRDFKLWKFRSMHTQAEKSGQLTIGMKDSRITKTGYYLRKYKLDELPQLINVLDGSMSFVGPRPEVRKYVDLYTAEQLRVLEVRPGITDYASLKYFKENELLGASSNPEQTYIQEVMPEKLSINLEYIGNKTMLTDLKIVFSTIFKVFTG
jgi:lipopolysaccharide/colanic/teichoic acid biosynthesis glycosyltransferase